MAIDEVIQELRDVADGIAGEFWLYMNAAVHDNPQPTVNEVINAYFKPINEGMTDDSLEDLERTMNAIAIIRERAIPEEFLDQQVGNYLVACSEGLITPFYDENLH
ncbi:MAG: hypothetical protein KKH52_03445 [Nanoarchaeota archaeon]|nr:hypothetical protein [Nanoarchaeota archaeon]MBU1622831.1 hypothetical protein [Nanoarchaeota archaeon]MBU1974422.1 hypothetical protein [Nanoarchaeota archaeon]